jgi:hypothetical protein
MIGFGVNDKIAPMSRPSLVECRSPPMMMRCLATETDKSMRWHAGTGTVRTTPADKRENLREVIGPLISGDREQHPSLSKYERRRNAHR